MVLIGDIKPAKYNPRTISEAAMSGLIESLRKFGMPQPLVVNWRSGVLVSGHQRLAAAHSLGWSEVPVVYVDLDPAQEKALNVTMNNRAIGGEFNDVLNVLLDDINGALGDEFMRSLRLNEIRVPEINFDEPSEKKEPAEKESDMASCPNCGVLLG